MRSQAGNKLERRQVGVLERRRIAVVLLPIGFGEQRFELLEHRRARVRGQDLELREGRSEIDRVVDRRRDRVPRVLQEAQDVETGRDDTQLAAVGDDLALVVLRNRPPSRFLERRRIERLDAEAHRAEARGIQTIEQPDVETVQPRFRFERELQAAVLDLIAELDAPVALLAEQRVAEDHVRLPHLIAQPLDLVDDVLDRARAVAGEDPVLTVGAELGTAPARQQREPAADRPRRPPDADPPAAILGDQIPPRKR